MDCPVSNELLPARRSFLAARNNQHWVFEVSIAITIPSSRNYDLRNGRQIELRIDLEEFSKTILQIFLTDFLRVSDGSSSLSMIRGIIERNAAPLLIVGAERPGPAHALDLI